MANMIHPGIVDIYDYFETEETPFGLDTLFVENTPVLVTRYEDQKTNLEQRLLHGPLLDYKDVSKRTLELASTIDYMAFERGIFHRD